MLFYYVSGSINIKYIYLDYGCIFDFILTFSKFASSCLERLIYLTYSE